MSNRANATRYTGAPEYRSGGSGGGSLDLFGIRTAHQKDIMNLQQAQELERIKAQAAADKDVDTTATTNEGNLYSRKVGLDAAKANGLVPANTSFNDLTKEQQDAINEYGLTHIKLQQKIQDNPDYQNAAIKGATAVQAKPSYDNAETAARARALSTTMLPPNTGAIIGMPNGMTGDQAQYASGPTQKVMTVGGITDPKTGQVIGGHPVETYGAATFPPVANLRPPTSNNGDSLNLNNTVATKPADPNVVQGTQPDSFNSMGMSFATQPAVGATPSVLTKPQDSAPGLIDPNSPGPAAILNLLRYLQSTNNPGLFRGIGQGGGSVAPSTF